MATDLRAILDPLIAVMKARPVVKYGPGSSGAQRRPTAMVEPALLPDAATVVLEDGTLGIDLGAQVALIQSALARFADLQIRTVSGSVTFASLTTPLIWLPGQSYDVPIIWASTPLVAPRGAVARVDASIVALGRVQAAVVDGSTTLTGCTVRCTVGGIGQIPIGIGTPLTVTAVGLYLAWPTYTGG